MKKACFLLFLLLLPLASSLEVKVVRGSISDLGAHEFLTEFGMIKGSINFRLGPYSWPPKEIWLVPKGSTPESFKSLGKYLELPEGLGPSACKTSIYFNSTLGYAFKILSSQIQADGSFCGLAYEGVYEVLAGF